MTTSSIVNIVTTLGTITVSIDERNAPVTASSFLRSVDDGLYDGSHFYRTVTPENQPNDHIRIAVIQGGICDLSSLKDAAGLPLERTSTTGLRHLDGTISMGRISPDSATTEFFICVGDQPELDFGGRRNPDGQGFAAFGQVLDGMDVVLAINASPEHEQNLTPPITIQSIRRWAAPS